MFDTRSTTETQQVFWIETRRLPQATASTSYRELDQPLKAIGFTAGVHEVCLPAYVDAASGGRPSIDPDVHFKMFMIGFFDNLLSERAIASRCADSLLLRAFLGYGLQAMPDHSSLSVIRGRLGIDSSVTGANASLRDLVHRNTEEQYWESVKRLAAEAGIDPDDTKAVRRFDKKREGRTTSNNE
jgi:transposase